MEVLGGTPLPGLGLLKARAGHLPEGKDVRVLGEGELVLLCVGRQLTDDLWRQVAQPATLDAELVFPPGEAEQSEPHFTARKGQTPSTNPSAWRLCWLSCVPPALGTA